MSLDNLNKISEAKGLHVCASHFSDRTGYYPRGGRTLSEIIGLRDTNPFLVVCGLRDPLTFNLNLNTADGSANLPVDTEAGVKSYSHEQYMGFVKQAQPDLCLSLSDDIPRTVKLGKKRKSKAQKRTAEWLEKSVQDFEVTPQSRELDAVGLVGSILASEDAEENVRQARLTSQLASGPSVVGYAIMGLGLGESSEARRRALSSICSKLSKDKMRYASGQSTPVDLLQAIECGIDVVDATFVNELTESGHAMVFPIDGVKPDGGATSTLPFNLNLWSNEYIHDQRPISETCGCYTCRNGFSRGYIHHLLQCRELLVQVLLEIHNTHHMCHFMKEVREKIVSGEFSQYSKDFQKMYNQLY